MNKFEPLISPTPRRSNHLSTDELLELLRRHGSIGKLERKWAFFRGAEGRLALHPTTGPRYLFRGQTARHVPCFPTIYRHYRYPAKFLDQLSAEDAAAIVASIAKTFMFFAELQRHPAAKWAKAENIELGLLEVAQHYGIATPLMDLSESIEVALFFATHDYAEGGGFLPRTEGRGVLYVVDRPKLPPAYAKRFGSIAIQPFARPFRQWAWSCELFMGECFEQCPCLAILEFEHSAALAHEIRARAEAQGDLFPSDLLAELGGAIGALMALPRTALSAAMNHLGSAYPAHHFGHAEGILREAGFHITQHYSPVYSESFWTQAEPHIRRCLDVWMSDVARDIERLVLLRNTRAEQPLEWATFNGLDVDPTLVPRLRPTVEILID